MIKINLKPITSEIFGLSEKQIQALRKELTYEVKSAKYITGWTGRECLLKASGAKYIFPTGLIDRIKSILGEDLEVTSFLPKREKDTNLAYFTDYAFKVRPYQVKAAMSVLNGGILQLPTGSGKTVCATKLIQLQQVKTLFVVHTKDLLYQAINNLTFLLKCPIGQIGDQICTIQDITVATYQSILQAFEGKRLVSVKDIRNYVEREAKLIIFDECHHVAAKSIQIISKYAQSVVTIVGLSASPWRDDGLDLLIESVCGGVKFKLTASDLINSGYLVPVEIHAQFFNSLPGDNLTSDHFSEENHEKYYAWIVLNPVRNAYIANLALKHINLGESVLILVKSLDHGNYLQELIPGSVFLEGKKSIRERKSFLADAKTGKLKCLIATSLADEGLDLPILSCLILAGAGSSSTKALQRIGRVLRPWPAPGEVLQPGKLAKSRAIIYDLIDRNTTFRNQYYQRQRIYQSEEAFKLIKEDINIY